MNAAIVKQKKLLESSLASLRIIEGYEHDESKVKQLEKAKYDYASALTELFQEVAQDLRIKVFEPVG